MKKIILSIIIAAVVLIALRFAYSAFGAKMKQKARAALPPPSVVVEEVKQDSVIRSFEAPGRVVSKYQVSIMARISGYLQKVFQRRRLCKSRADFVFNRA